MHMPRTIASRRTKNAPARTKNATTARDPARPELWCAFRVDSGAHLRYRCRLAYPQLGAHARARPGAPSSSRDGQRRLDNDACGLHPLNGARRPKELLTLALLEDLATVLHAHGFHP
ncbi:MAG: hypothetical protein JWO12_1157 [Frankiales bacterium]|nr:hypothetical protein [Frankiales bacterium]